MNKDQENITSRCNTAFCSSYPIVEHSILGHAVRSAELLHPASIVAVQHLLANARAVCAGTPRVILVTRGQVLYEAYLTVCNTGRGGVSY